ncbi:MAG: branched-chain amino acid aminotransferase, partial [bacterium]
MVPALDRGLLFGDGVFETIRAYRGLIFRLDRHLDRLRRSMDGLELDWPFTHAGVLEALTELLTANGLAVGADEPDPRDARIRITVTGGLSDGRVRLARTAPPTVIMSAV